MGNALPYARTSLTQVPQILYAAVKASLADNIFRHSAAVSFYTLFSLAPITIFVLALAGALLGTEVASQQFHDQVAQLVGPASAEMIQSAAKAGESAVHGRMSAAIGIVILLVGATTVFAQLQDSLNTIWGVRSRVGHHGWLLVVIRRLLSFAMVLVVGFLLLVSLIITTALSAFVGSFNGSALGSPGMLKAADLGVGLVVITALFALLFKVLPDVRVSLREVWPGALLTAILFTIGRYVIALYLGHSTVATIYGTGGSLVALLIWVYYSCAILLFGVEFTHAHYQATHHRIDPRAAAVVVGPDHPPTAPLRRHHRAATHPGHRG